MTLAKLRVLGVLRIVDDNERDDKIIAVYDCDPRFIEYEGMKEVPKHIIAELKYFFETYKELQGKKCKILEILDKKDAWKDIQLAQKLYDMKYRPDKLIVVENNLK